MFYSILKESGYFQLKNLHNHPLSKRYELMKSNFSFMLFSLVTPILLTVSLYSNSLLMGFLGMLVLASVPLYIAYLKKQYFSLGKYLKENCLSYFKNENNLIILYKELKKDPHFDNILLDSEIKLLIGSLEDGSFETSLMYLLEKWKRKKDEAVVEENKKKRYEDFLQKLSEKEITKKLNSITYEEYL
jgi:hypothetical protein